MLDAGGLRLLAERSTRALALVVALRDRGLWPPLVPAPVLVECLSGDAESDEALERFLHTVDVVTDLGEALARRAAWLRTAAGRGSSTEALVVALAEPGGAVLTRGNVRIEAMALFAERVFVERA
ncbi:MAG: hypothetical protein GEV08_07175 [Acidimicrobiia bacterium]|nr:hypothetical protein [Acidimicrobiia bacterium]